MVIVGKTHIKRLCAVRQHTYDLRFKILEQAAFAEHDGNIFPGTALKHRTVDLAFKIKGDAITRGGGTTDVFIGRALLAHDVNGFIYFGFADFHQWPRNRDFGNIADRHIRINLKCRAE